MDDRRFDNAVRSLARHRSRRGVVGGLLGEALALLASHLRLPARGGPPPARRPGRVVLRRRASAIRGSSAPGTDSARPARPVARMSAAAATTTLAVAAPPPASAEPAPMSPPPRRRRAVPAGWKPLRLCLRRVLLRLRGVDGVTTAAAPTRGTAAAECTVLRLQHLRRRRLHQLGRKCRRQRRRREWCGNKYCDIMATVLQRELRRLQVGSRRVHGRCLRRLPRL